MGADHDMIDFNAFFGIVRNPLPGMNLKQREISDDEVKGIWKVIDVDRWGKITKGEFMRFFREHSDGNGEASEALTRQIQANVPQAGEARATLNASFMTK